MNSYHGLERIDSDSLKRKIVLDASVVAKWILSGEPWEKKALELKEKFVNGEIEIYEPILIVYEIANLLLRAVKEGRIDFNDAKTAMKSLNKLGIELFEIDFNQGSELLNTAKQLHTTVYDTAYISLAKELKATLISADDEMCKKAKTIVKTKHLKEI